MNYREMTAIELNSYIQSAQPSLRLLDVREPWEYEKCHLEGSLLVPMRQIPNAINEFNPEEEIVIICHHGIRSRSVAMYLAHQQFSRVINLSGGIDEWAKQVDPSMPTY